ncbi:hypothetical protein LOK49_LG04G02520 [Camellia lanceoleosa]|uniref:Uncharacterized protein n=1 Tax=Camellia lanceoleosa TaxID=1840588 RepID=A0ACC0HXM7_9ERIC|nr:hypothetical protein LOK49_LG04G02520 [Camellia lanceoleosa]
MKLPIRFRYTQILNCSCKLEILWTQNVQGHSSNKEAWTFIIDGSWKSATGNAGIAWIYLDHNMHQIKRQVIVKTSLQDPLMAKANACLEAARWAMK